MPESPQNSLADGSNPATLEINKQYVGAHGFRWYYFYFILAFFDVLVIIGSLALYHNTLVSYKVAINEVKNIDRKHQWVEDLRRTLINLNAPGNDVFATHRVDIERKRFDLARTESDRIVEGESEFDVDLSSFRDHIQRMVGEGQTIFKIFEKLGNPGRLKADERDRLKQVASNSMASMDRAQADGLKRLSEIEGALLAEKNRLLVAYGMDLARSANIEKYFMVIVILILVGIFYYGRKLHRTHEKILQNEQRSITERQQRLAEVGKVCAAVAHGIRNPLASITSSAQLVLETCSIDDATRGYLNNVLSDGQRLGKRISRLLDFSRAPNRTFEQFDVKEVIEQAIAEIRPALDKRSIQIESDLDPRSTSILGDRDLLAQSFIEVLSNALDHLESGGRISIACRRDENHPGFMYIRFIDDGPGIAEHIRPRVFDLFFTSKANGSGVGLASVKRSIECHGGEVVALSTEGGGAHIRILLPLA